MGSLVPLHAYTYHPVEGGLSFSNWAILIHF